MADRNTHPAAGIAPATRIPLYQVKAALHCASATLRAKAALQAALDCARQDDWLLREFIRAAADAAGFAQRAAHMFNRYAVGGES